MFFDPLEFDHPYLLIKISFFLLWKGILLLDFSWFKTAVAHFCPFFIASVSSFSSSSSSPLFPPLSSIPILHLYSLAVYRSSINSFLLNLVFCFYSNMGKGGDGPVNTEAVNVLSSSGGSCQLLSIIESINSSISIIKQIYIDSRYYDVTNMRHPGGSVINFYSGKEIDASEAFMNFHIRSKKAKKYLASLPSRWRVFA